LPRHLDVVCVQCWLLSGSSFLKTLDIMQARGTRGAYRKEDRVQLPPDLQKELVEKAAARYGSFQELARHLNIPKSSVHYYRVGRLTMPLSVLEEMLKIAGDEDLRSRVESKGIEKDRGWATEYAQDVFREMCREKVRLPTREEQEKSDELRRKAAAVVSYVLAEGSVWLQKREFGEHAVNITFAAHENDLYEHFRSLCKDVFRYDIGPPQKPGNDAKAIRGFIYSRFVAEWLVHNGIRPGDKSAQDLRLPSWVMDSDDSLTLKAALQPWCDGEGGVHRSSGRVCAGFSLVQSRHSDLDFFVLPKKPGWRGKGRLLNMGQISRIEVFGVPLIQYVSAFARSEILDDVRILFERLGFHPRMMICSLHLKDNGFWSCIWKISLSSRETMLLVERNIITQARKRRAALGR
jgi:hypothetical protein